MTTYRKKLSEDFSSEYEKLHKVIAIIYPMRKENKIVVLFFFSSRSKWTDLSLFPWWRWLPGDVRNTQSLLHPGLRDGTFNPHLIPLARASHQDSQKAKDGGIDVAYKRSGLAIGYWIKQVIVYIKCLKNVHSNCYFAVFIIVISSYLAYWISLHLLLFCLLKWLEETVIFRLGFLGCSPLPSQVRCKVTELSFAPIAGSPFALSSLRCCPRIPKHPKGSCLSSPLCQNEFQSLILTRVVFPKFQQCFPFKAKEVLRICLLIYIMCMSINLNWWKWTSIE